jgi:hypothetical protein
MSDIGTVQALQNVSSSSNQSSGIGFLFAAMGLAALLNGGGSGGYNSRRSSIKQTIPSVIWGYGTDRLGGKIMLDEVNGPWVSRVLAVCDGRTAGPRQWYMNDDRVVLNDAGEVQTVRGVGYEDNRIKCDVRYGLTAQTAFSVGAYWSPACHGNGVSAYKTECKAGKSEDFSSQFPYGKPEPSIAWDFLLCYDWRDPSQSRSDQNTWKWTDNPVVCLVNELWCRHGYDWDRRFAPTLSLLTASANICDEMLPVKNVLGLVMDHEYADNGWTDIRLSNANGLRDGIQITIAPGEDEEETITVASVDEAQADRFYFSLMPRYVVHLKSGLASEHSCFKIVKWQSDPAYPAMQKRYTFNHWFDGDDLSSVISTFLGCMGGWMSRNGSGAVIIKPFKWEYPTVIWTDRDIIGWKWQSRTGRERTANELKLNFVSPEFDYRSVETDSLRDEEDIAKRGRAMSTSFSPKGVQYDNQLKRLAKLEMPKYQRPKNSIITRLSRIEDKKERFVRVQVENPPAGFPSSVVVEIVDAPQLGDDGLSIVWPVREVRAEDDQFDPFTEEGGGPEIVSKGGVSTNSVPFIIDVQPFFDASGGNVQLQVTATGPDRDDLDWHIYWRVQGSSSWNDNQVSTDDYPDVTLSSAVVPVESEIEVQVAYSANGTLSEKSTMTTVSTSTSNIAPPKPTNLTATKSGTTVTLKCRAPTTSNYVGIRFLRSGSGGSYSSATDVSGLKTSALGADITFDNTGLAAGTYQYWAISENAAGDMSAPAPDASHPVTITI